MEIDKKRYLTLSVNNRSKTVVDKAKSLSDKIFFYCHTVPEFREMTSSKEEINQKLKELIEEFEVFIYEADQLRALRQNDGSTHKGPQEHKRHD